MVLTVLSHIRNLSVQPVSDAATIQKLEALEPSFFRFSYDKSHADLTCRRIALLKTLAESRHSAVFSKVFSLQGHSEKVRLLSLEKAALQELIKAQKCWFNKTEARKKAFEALSPACRNKLYWAIWLIKGAPHVPDFGKTTPNSNIGLLFEKQLPLLHMKGGNLAEQLLYFTEQQLAYEQEEEICHH